MHEQVEKELAKAAEVLEMDIEDVNKKYAGICEEHNLTDEQWKLSLGVFRQWFSGTKAYADAPANESSGKDSLIKQATGYFISVDAARDMAAMQNERIKGEYLRNPSETFSTGRVATVTQSDGTYAVVRMYDGEEQTTNVSDLPNNNFEIEEGLWIVPLDNMPAYGERANPNYGKPLPAEQYRMAGIFLGEVEGDRGVYFFSYKGEASKSFNPTTFSMIHMAVIRDQNNTNRLYGFKNGTLDSLYNNAELPDDAGNKVEEPSVEDYQNFTMEYSGDNYSPLIDLNRYHVNVGDLPYAERYVVTDGSVSSVNMTPNSYGTRRVTITDLNSDFNYEGGSWAGTTCWFPKNIGIDFGIGSSVIVVGRTSQGRNDDGSIGDVTINVSGVLCVENQGVVAEPFEQTEEEDLDWF